MWLFKITIKNVFEKGKIFKHAAFSKVDYSWRDAWVKCVDKAISGLSDCEVIVSIESVNEIVTGSSNIVNEIINDSIKDF